MLNFNLFADPFNLYLAWIDFKKGKTQKADTVLFERNLEDNLFQLSEELLSGSYHHQPYKKFFVRDPKWREINKATVRDRIMHQALYNELYPFFSKSFFFDSYSSIIGKGTYNAIQRANSFILKKSDNFKKSTWVLHGDVKNFFASVDHSVLYNQLQTKIKNDNFLKLCYQIIDSYHCDQNQGLPLGNLTSQIFANIYLHELDYHIKQELKIKYYLRYNDDFYIISNSRNELVEIGNQIQRFAIKKLKLDIPQNKLVVRNINSGVDVLGTVFYPWGKIPRQRLKIRAQKALINYCNTGYNSISWPKLVSYIGSLQQSNSFWLQEKLRLNVHIY